MPGRKFVSGEGYRFGFNGVEKSPEISEGHNTTFFREMDARIGRWWSNDPVFQPHQSPYNMMDGNPILYIDPRGDKVKKIKSRELRRKIKALKKKSKSFREMYKTLKRDKKKTFVFEEIESRDPEKAVGGKTFPSIDDPNTIMIQIPKTLPSSVQDVEREKFAFIAHETAHAFRHSLNLVSHGPKMPESYVLDKTSPEAKKYVEKTISDLKTEETVAVHVENIVLSELQKSGKEAFKNFSFTQYYQGMPEVKIIERKAKGFSLQKTKSYYIGRSVFSYKTMIYPVSESYYKNTDFNIHKEIKRTDLKSDNPFGKNKKLEFNFN